MNTQEFEQAKRDLAQKWEIDLHRQKILLSDLTVLLEQHKEMMMEFVRWLFWCDYRMTEEGLHSTYVSTPSGTLVELYEWWLKNVKN